MIFHRTVLQQDSKDRLRIRQTVFCVLFRRASENIVLFTTGGIAELNARANREIGVIDVSSVEGNITHWKHRFHFGLPQAV